VFYTIKTKLGICVGFVTYIICIKLQIIGTCIFRVYYVTNHLEL